MDTIRDSQDDRVRNSGLVHDQSHGNREPDQTDW
jgi:hypothetical protein